VKSIKQMECSYAKIRQVFNLLLHQAFFAAYMAKRRREKMMGGNTN